MKALLARAWLTLHVTSLRAQCDLLWQWTWDARKTPGQAEGGRDKEFKGQRSKSGFGERSGKKEYDPMPEINQVMWDVAQTMVLLEISWAESQTVWWFWVRSFSSRHQRMRSWPSTGNDSSGPCFPSPLLKDIDIIPTSPLSRAITAGNLFTRNKSLSHLF